MSRAGDFWSRRKARVEAEAEAEARTIEAAERVERDAALSEKTDEELCAELGLPDPDALQMGDDFRAFLDKAVPERLRRRALRRLWVSNPVLANLDGLVDYADDFTDSAMVVADMKTTYQVGKGMLAHVEEMARQAEALARGPEVPEAEDVAETEVTQAAVAQEPEARPQSEPEAQVVMAEAEGDDTPLPPRRRMRFQFDDQAGVSA